MASAKKHGMCKQYKSFKEVWEKQLVDHVDQPKKNKLKKKYTKSVKISSIVRKRKRQK